MNPHNCNLVKVLYKSPYSDIIFDIMLKNSLTDTNKLLNNIEKILPISKVLENRDNKKISRISYEKNLKSLIFKLYFN